MEDTQELIAEFLVECGENLEVFEQNLLELEQNPTEQSLLDSMFRMIHTIKGASGFMAFENLESLAHKAENVLDLLRSGKGVIDSSLISIFLSVCDAIKAMFESIEENSNDGENNYQELKDQLNTFEQAFKSGEAAPKAEPKNDSVFQEPLQKISEELSQAEEPVATAPASAGTTEESEPELDEAQIAALKSLGVYEEPAEAKKEDTAVDSDSELDEAQIAALKSLGMYQEDQTSVQQEAAPTAEQQEAPKQAEPAKPAKAKEVKQQADKKAPIKRKETIRVDVDTLDKLVNLAGELVLVRNQLLELAKNNESSVFSNSIGSLNIVTGEIQRSLMTTRMQPISMVWSKMPRVVRDLSSQLGKEIEIIMQGENTELDKTIIEAITDPMTHIIRNCCDHGIEMPEDRVAKGKKAKGTVQLVAEHRGNWIHVDVIDDGKGISRDVLRRKAIEKELYTEEELEAMEDQEILNIIFHPGFSTKDQASNISGRGVGMDVIKSNINKIDGKVELASEEGKGTHLKLKLPLTLAIIPAVIVSIKNSRYAIPQNTVQEFASVDVEKIQEFDDINGQKFTRLRGEILPLIFASEFLGLEQEADMSDRDSINYVVINIDGFCYGLVIDSVIDIIEIVVKPLNSLEDFSYYAGSTIMGDGRIAMILDSLKIAEESKIERKANLDSDSEASQSSSGSHADNLTLTFKLDNGKNYIIPLSKTSRIEEINLDQIEERQTGTYARFQNRIIRIINIKKLLNLDFYPEAEQQDDKSLKVLYYEFNNHGIAIDIGYDQNLIQRELEIEESDSSELIIGTTLIDETIYEVLSIEDYLGNLVGLNDASHADIQAMQSTLEKNNASSAGDDSYLFDEFNAVISFKVEDLIFGVDLDAVSEIVNIDDITSTPGARSSIKGLINLRGDIMIARDLREVLSLSKADSEEESVEDRQSLIIKDGNNKVCLEVGNVKEIVNFKEAELQKAPANIPENILDYIKGVYNTGKTMLLLLDEKKFFLETSLV